MKGSNQPTAPGHSGPSKEQTQALFQTLLRKISTPIDRRQLEDATFAALRLMLRRPTDKELLDSLLFQCREIIHNLPDIIQGQKAKADLRKGSLCCIELLKQAKKLRKPRSATPRNTQESNQIRNWSLGIFFLLAAAIGGLGRYYYLENESHHSAAQLTLQIEQAAKGGKIATHVFGGALTVERQGERIAVKAEQVPATTCVSVAWKLIHEGTVSINHVIAQRVTANLLSEQCHQQPEGATIIWSPDPSVSR